MRSSSVQQTQGRTQGGAQGARAPPSENLNHWPEKLLTLQTDLQLATES